MPASLSAICLALATPASPTGEAPPVPRLRPLPPIRAQAAHAEDFAPPGWRIVDRASGDLNADGRPDVVLVLKGADPACRAQSEIGLGSFDANPYVLLVAFRNATGYGRQVVEPNLIPRREDPFTEDALENGEISVQKSVLRVKLGYWRSAGAWESFIHSFAFRWDGRGFALIGFDSDRLMRNTGETQTLSINYLTRRARATTGLIEEDTDETVRWSRLRRSPGHRLGQMGDGLAFRPRP